MRQDDNAPCVICSEITAMLRMAGSAAVTATGIGAKYAEQRYMPYSEMRWVYPNRRGVGWTIPGV